MAEKITGEMLQRDVAALLGWTAIEKTPRGKLEGVPPGGVSRAVIPHWHLSVDLCFRDLVPDGNGADVAAFARALSESLYLHPSVNAWATWAHGIKGHARPMILCAAFIKAKSAGLIEVPGA